MTRGIPPESPRVAGSSVLLTAGGVVSGGLALVFHLLTARGLGPVGYGMLTASLAYAVLWAIDMEARAGLPTP